MSAIRLKPKNLFKSKPNTKYFCTLFSTFDTEAKSCQFMKKLTAMCLSTILYARKVLPTECFKPIDCEGISLYLLKSGKKYMHAAYIEKLLEGAFEAIEKKYLKQFILDIQDSTSKMTLEMYTMTFTYFTGNEKLKILLSNHKSKFNSRAISEFSKSSTKSKAIQLLQMCDIITCTYEVLPSQFIIDVRLSYYEKTPIDYQPPGFKAWEPNIPLFDKVCKSIEIGRTETKYHSFKLVNRSRLNASFLKELNVLQKKSNLESRKSFHFTKHIKNLSVQDNKTEIKSLKQQKQKKKLSGRKQESFRGKVLAKIRCPCQVARKSELMLFCSLCKYLAHAECFGAMQLNLNEKTKFFCNICHDPKRGIKCPDKVLINLKKKSDQQKVALLRRMLKFCNLPHITKITLKKIQKMFDSDCSKNTIDIVFKKMIDIGVIEPQKKKKNFFINKASLSREITQFFYKPSNSLVLLAKDDKRLKTKNISRKDGLQCLDNNLNKNSQLLYNLKETVNEQSNNIFSQQSNDLFK